MAALTRPWVRAQIGDLPVRRSIGPLPIKGAVGKIYPGALLVIETGANTGWAKPAVSGANVRVVGIYGGGHGGGLLPGEIIDTVGKTSGFAKIEPVLGCFKFKNSAANPVLPIHIGAQCQVEDDATVGIDANSANVGKVCAISEDGSIEVEIR